MRIVIADDSGVPRLLLEKVLDRMGHEVVVTEDGEAAWNAIVDHAPHIAILDWMMPGVDGIEICRRLREEQSLFGHYIYVIMLTSREAKDDVVLGLESGADDYMVKPCDTKELAARIHTGQRIIELQNQLAGKIGELQEALDHVKKLQGLLPICMHCKSIRDDSDTWHKLESYISNHSDVMFSHSLCGECLQEHYPEQSDRVSDSRGQ
ncbi:hypothetical protein ABI59_14730 [Acidobacteria bacterium Mor1]|nr:hypothetical protein ABI59_14730 [Acidobacteria bacterium Mor1]